MVSVARTWKFFTLNRLKTVWFWPVFGQQGFEPPRDTWRADYADSKPTSFQKINNLFFWKKGDNRRD
jgi:hypothetical protein